MKNRAMLTDYCKQAGIPFELDSPLEKWCSFRVGGPAALVAEPGTEEEIAGLMRLANREGIPMLTLGKGSNVLFADEGYQGLVLALGSRFARMELRKDGLIYSQSGASLAQLCRFALQHGLAGLEFAYGIPGTVGGAVFMNAGAYGGEIRDVLVSARHLEPGGEPGEYAGESLELGYRHSAYSDGRRVITGALFSLKPGKQEEIRAGMEDFLARRREKQPLEFPSAGSTFKRPAGNYASALIDRCGLKGYRSGGAMVSEKHAGFVINAGGATCRDVLEVIAHVRAEVLRQTGYDLECEVRLIR